MNVDWNLNGMTGALIVTLGGRLRPPNNPPQPGVRIPISRNLPSSSIHRRGPNERSATTPTIDSTENLTVTAKSPNPYGPIINDYFQRSPEAAARSLETMERDEALAVISLLPPKLAARTIRELQANFAAALLDSADSELLVGIAKGLPPEHAASILLNLSETSQTEFLSHLPDKRKKAIQEFLTFPFESVGRLMTTELIAMPERTTVKTARDQLRTLAKKNVPSSYLYVTNAEKQLKGVVNMRSLLIADRAALLEDIMSKEVFSLHAFIDREEAAEEIGKRRYFAAPVVDSENHLLGVIRAETLFSGVREEAAEDMQRMVGVGSHEKAFSPIGFSLKQRLPWLHVNLLTAFLAASVVAFFEDTIARITVLAIFLPVVAGQGGNGGAQSLAIVMRGLVMREIPDNMRLRLVLKETFIASIGGLITGAVTAFIAWLWFGNPHLGLVVALGMLVTMCAAGFAGAAIPLIMRYFGLDPAQCSNIILTTVTDVVGFFAFLGFAKIFEAKLI